VSNDRSSGLFTDVTDYFKTVVYEVDVQHQVCKASVVRNTQALIEPYKPLIAKDAKGSL
jgi:hypothetical protein